MNDGPNRDDDPCIAEYHEANMKTAYCELPSDHDGMHLEGCFRWSEERSMRPADSRSKAQKDKDYILHGTEEPTASAVGSHLDRLYAMRGGKVANPKRSKVK
jgi:hypothetical protein